MPQVYVFVPHLNIGSIIALISTLLISLSLFLSALIISTPSWGVKRIVHFLESLSEFHRHVNIARGKSSKSPFLWCLILSGDSALQGRKRWYQKLWGFPEPFKQHGLDMNAGKQDAQMWGDSKTRSTKRSLFQGIENMSRNLVIYSWGKEIFLDIYVLLNFYSSLKRLLVKSKFTLHYIFATQCVHIALLWSS